MTETVLDSGLVVPFAVPAYPPPVPVDTRVNTTPQTDNHPADHNMLSDGIASIINVLGTTPQGSFSSLTARLTDSDAGPRVWYGTAAGPFGLSGSWGNFGLINATGLPSGVYLLVATAYLNQPSFNSIINLTAMYGGGTWVGTQSHLQTGAASATAVSASCFGLTPVLSGSQTFGVSAAANGASPTIQDMSMVAVLVKRMN